jgi:rare lipoprotein A
MPLQGLAPWIKTCLLVAAGVVLASCAETELVTNTAKEIKQAATPAETKAQPVYKIGKPYQVDGVWYYPGEDYEYSGTGIASWYGPEFDGKPTANGEIFDMNEVTAAHKTLPLPSVVRVTNLENGRSLLVRINDRGPFVNGRIIDLSRRSAQLLGYEAAGTAKVRVEIEADQSRQLAAALPRDPGEAVPGTAVVAAPRAPVEAQELGAPGSAAAPKPAQSAAATQSPAAAKPAPASPALAPASGKPPPSGGAPTATAAAKPVKPPPPVVTQASPGPTNMYIQAGAYSQFDNANRMKALLSPLGEANISPVFVNDQQLFRVRLGPIGDLISADRMLDRVIKAGYKDAQLIVAE